MRFKIFKKKFVQISNQQTSVLQPTQKLKFLWTFRFYQLYAFKDLYRFLIFLFVSGFQMALKKNWIDCLLKYIRFLKTVIRWKDSIRVRTISFNGLKEYEISLVDMVTVFVCHKIWICVKNTIWSFILRKIAKWCFSVNHKKVLK